MRVPITLDTQGFIYQAGIVELLGLDIRSLALIDKLHTLVLEVLTFEVSFAVTLDSLKGPRRP